MILFWEFFKCGQTWQVLLVVGLFSTSLWTIAHVERSAGGAGAVITKWTYMLHVYSCPIVLLLLCPVLTVSFCRRLSNPWRHVNYSWFVQKMIFKLWMTWTELRENDSENGIRENMHFSSSIFSWKYISDNWKKEVCAWQWITSGWNGSCHSHRSLRYIWYQLRTSVQPTCQLLVVHIGSRYATGADWF